MSVDVSKIFFAKTKKIDISKYFEQFDGSNDAYIEIKRLDSYKIKALNNMSLKRFDTQVYMKAQEKIENLYFDKGIDVKEYGLPAKNKSDKQLQKEIKQKQRDFEHITKEIMNELSEADIKKQVENEKEIDNIYLNESIIGHNLENDGKKIELDIDFWENVGKITVKGQENPTLKEFVIIEIINFNRSNSLGELIGKQ
jgi:hypothetical protein